MTPTILVTGGAGYVGSHACKALHAAGYQPVVYDSLVRGHRWAVKWGPLEEGDIADGARVRAVVRRYQPVAAMHFASLIFAGESVADPGSYYGANVAGSWMLFEALRAEGIRNVVFSSTAAVYGNCPLPKIPETAPYQPVNPYGFTKLAIEQMLRDYAAAYGMRAICPRYFNAAGADPDTEIGEAHDPEYHLIPLVLEVAAGMRPHIDIYGTDYPTPDGTCIRDYIHVSDLASAHVKALQKLLAAPAGPAPRGDVRAFNLGTGRGHSVKELIEAARRVTNRPIPAQIKPRRPGDPPSLVADASLANRELDWQSKFDSLDSILETAWRWLQKSRANPLEKSAAQR